MAFARHTLVSRLLSGGLGGAGRSERPKSNFEAFLCLEPNDESTVFSVTARRNEQLNVLARLYRASDISRPVEVTGAVAFEIDIA